MLEKNEPTAPVAAVPVSTPVEMDGVKLPAVPIVATPASAPVEMNSAKLPAALVSVKPVIAQEGPGVSCAALPEAVVATRVSRTFGVNAPAAPVAATPASGTELLVEVEKDPAVPVAATPVRVTGLTWGTSWAATPVAATERLAGEICGVTLATAVLSVKPAAEGDGPADILPAMPVAATAANVAGEIRRVSAATVPVAVAAGRVGEVDTESEPAVPVAAMPVKGPAPTLGVKAPAVPVAVAAGRVLAMEGVNEPAVLARVKPSTWVAKLLIEPAAPDAATPARAVGVTDGTKDPAVPVAATPVSAMELLVEAEKEAALPFAATPVRLGWTDMTPATAPVAATPTRDLSTSALAKVATAVESVKPGLVVAKLLS